MKRLLLLRHAKTEQANKDTPADAERALTARGREDAPLVGRAMREKGYVPDLILCSPSVRTRQTLELARGEFDGNSRVEFVNAIYAASARQLVQIIRDISDRARKPLLVGHNPGFEECAALLMNKSDAAATGFDANTDKFPTSALVALDFDISHWTELKPHTGKLVDIIRPKDLKS
jgi:phosphohistidine phosphatase